MGDAKLAGIPTRSKSVSSSRAIRINSFPVSCTSCVAMKSSSVAEQFAELLGNSGTREGEADTGSDAQQRSYRRHSGEGFSDCIAGLVHEVLHLVFVFVRIPLVMLITRV